MSVEPVEFIVPADFEGQRLDRFLVSVLEQHSRSQIQKLISDGHVTVPRRHVRANLSVHEGDRITVTLQEAVPSRLEGEALPSRSFIRTKTWPC